MATSLYGTVKKIGSSYFTFDQIYNNRKAMEDAMATDGIYHGRYVLVSYGDAYATNNLQANSSIIIDIPATDNTESVHNEYTTNLNEDWVRNYNIDLQYYNNVYDKTVWQKIFDGATEKYIMIASLLARAPGLTINEDYYSFNLDDDANGRDYYIKASSEGTVVTKKAIATYPIPKWQETLSNDLIYHLDMPMPLHINLGNFNYAAEGFNPIYHTNLTPSTNNDNYIRWEHILKANSSNEVIAADFNFNIPRLGETISDAYDALYGVPLDENDEITNGTRPFVTEADAGNLKEATQEALSQTDYKGLLYILSHIGLRASDGHYLLSSDWSVPVHEFGHIDNKPEIINNISVATSGANIGLWTLTVEQQS